jgi:class 3 adenylate cyclase/tetratricopeptide (TPR) repeat protein
VSDASEVIRVAASQESTQLPGDGERKTVSALFADIKGSTELMEDLDPEEARALIDPALQLMIEAARRYDGYIVQSTGDGIFALFGAPVAHEEHPQRAVLAALRMQEGIRGYAARLRADGRPPIEIRVGINSGEVVIRSIRTGEHSAEYTPIGHTANLAARLQAIAPTGAIVASANTARLIAGYFELKPMGPVRVKGVSEAVSVYEIVGRGALRTRLQASAARGLTRFVGRRAELDLMERALESAKSGHGRIVAASGEAGLGKSRLFHEFKATVSGCLVLEGIAASHGKASPWLPVIGLLNDYFGLADNDSARARREKVAGRTLMLERELEDALPYLFSLLGILDGPDPFEHMDVTVRRKRMLMAIGRVLMRESHNQPLMLIFEDLHWIDSSTQALLDLIAEHIGGDRALMLANYRPEYRHKWIAYPYYDELRLSPLADGGAREMLAGLLGDGVAIDGEMADLARLIEHRTGGNPLFIEEITRALFEQGILVRNGAVKLARSIGEVRIPPTVEGILAARIDRLAAPAKEFLQRIAVLGREFSIGAARAMASADGDAQALQNVERMLASLQAADFINEEFDGAEAGYSFKHALTQEVAYNSILSERRKLLHRRAAEAIETSGADRLDAHLAELAHHYRNAGDAAKAADYLSRAADQAARRVAYAEAVDHLRAAIKLIEALPEGTERDRRELDLQSFLGECLIPLRSPASVEVKDAFDRARELSQRLGDLDSLFWVLFGLQFFYSLRHDLTTAQGLGERQLIMAERAGDPAMRAAACGALATTMLMLGEFETTIDLCERGLAAAAQTRADVPVSSIGNPRPLMLSLAASSLMILGYPARAIERSRAALAEGEAAGPYSHALALNYAGQLRIRLCDFDGALEFADALAALARDKGFPVWEAQAIYLRGSALIELGRAEEGMTLLRASGAAYESTGAVAGIWRLDAAEALGKLGRADEALELLEQVRETAGRSGIGLIASGVLRVRAGLILRKGGADADDAAEKLLREAIAIARRQRARLFELRAAIELAKLLSQHGRLTEAQAELAPACAAFTDGFDFPYLKQARALLGVGEEKAGEAPISG